MSKLRSVASSNGHRIDPVAQARAVAEALAPFGLEPGEQIRFHKKEGDNWLDAKVTGVNKDGSLEIFSQGKIRAIMADSWLIEHKTRGPRGGVAWEPLETT